MNTQYNKLCEYLLSFAENDEIKNKMKLILYDGKIGDFSVDSGIMKNNELIEQKKRIGYAYLLASNPNTFEEFLKNNINLFHGTNSNSISSILKYGMMSLKEQDKNKITNTTGERWSRIKNHPRSFISLTDDLDLAMDYSTGGKFEDGSFEVIIGISTKDIHNLKQVPFRNFI